jgi:hypothetical protein
MRLCLGHLKPITTLGTAPGAIANCITMPLSIVMFFLSIQDKDKNSNNYNDYSCGLKWNHYDQHWNEERKNLSMIM